MKDINGKMYSRKSFPEYVNRFIVDIYATGQFYPSRFNIYTTETDHDKFLAVLKTLVTESVVKYNIVEVASREKDDFDSKFIDDILNNI